MNLNDVKAALTKNKVPLGIGGAALVAGAAFYSTRGKTATGSSSGAAASTRSAGVSTSPSYYTAGSAGTYDSSSSDAYNAFQPQIEQLSQAVNDLRASNSIPVPTMPAPVASEPAATVPAYLMTSDPRRASIIEDYRSILGRTNNIGLSELNWWDAQPLDLTAIRQGFLTSPEAQGK